jgi:DNA-binding MarR family transcriptional regulator
MANIQSQLWRKLEISGLETTLSQKEKSILALIQSRPNLQSGEISRRLFMPLPTVKRILSGLLLKGVVLKQGRGRNVTYHVV